MLNILEIRCFTVPRRPSFENVLVSPVFSQMAPLDPDWTTTSCTNSATTQRCCWTAPGVPRRTLQATRSPVTWTQTWSGGIPAARMTSWFSWRYILTLTEDMMSLPPTKIRESHYSHLISCSFSDLKCEGGASYPSTGEEQHPPRSHSREYFRKNQPGGSDQTVFVAS